MKKQVDNTRLYVIVRTDLLSLNPGKAMAQVAHAANMCEWKINKSKSKKLKDAWKKWQGDRGFGTTIVLESGKLREISEYINWYKKHYSKTMSANMVLDPTYPLKDGDYTHLIPVETCGFIFDSEENIKPPFNLHR